jgi:hypothetical protein
MCLADPATREPVAAYAELTAGQSLDLAMDSDEGVRISAARNATLSAEALAILASDESASVRGMIAQHRYVDPATRDRIYADPDAAGELRSVVLLDFFGPGWVRELPLSERLVFLECPHVVFRRALAWSRDLPAVAWRGLDQDSDVPVRWFAAMRPDAPPEILERLLHEHGGEGPVGLRVTDHPNFPWHMLRGFADSPDPTRRSLALADPDLPDEVVNALAGDQSAYVRFAAAGHPAIGAEQLRVLLAETDLSIASRAAENPALPAELMYELLEAAGI